MPGYQNGFDSARCLELQNLLNREIQGNHMAGASVGVYKGGQPVFQTDCGMADRENGVPIKQDTIFRLYSMSKPVAATAAMILYERGDLDLKTPVSAYFPSFKHQKVCAAHGLEEACREVLVEDLLNMTSGLVYPDSDACGRRMEALFNRVQDGIKEKKETDTVALCNLIGEQPLAFQPGERWRYGTSADVLGGIIEVISGMKLGEFYQKTIFGPLGMADTGFYVPESKQHRFAQLYRQTAENGACALRVETTRHLCLTDCLHPPGFESAGAGLVSTMGDCARLGSMLGNGGCYQGIRILGRKTVEMMVRNQLNPNQLKTVDFAQMAGYGYGTLMRVMQDPTQAADSSSVGTFGWDGWSGPYLSVDPREQLVFLFMTQIAGYSNWPLLRKMHAIVYAALE